MKSDKEKIYNQLQRLIEQRITTARHAMQSAEDAKNSETKSSAGDKFETGRAMMQGEQERNKIQLIKAMALKKELTQINIEKTYDKVELGSLLLTNQGHYFISIGLGKIEVEDKKYFAISLAAPIGQLFRNKKIGEEVIFQNKAFRIIDII